MKYLLQIFSAVMIFSCGNVWAQEFQPIQRQMPVPSSSSAGIPNISPAQGGIVAVTPPSPLKLLANEMDRTKDNLSDMEKGLKATQGEVSSRLENINNKIDRVSGKTDMLSDRLQKNEARIEAVSKSFAERQARAEQTQKSTDQRTNANNSLRKAHERASSQRHAAPRKARAQVIISTPDSADSPPPVASMPAVVGN